MQGITVGWKGLRYTDWRRRIELRLIWSHIHLILVAAAMLKLTKKADYGLIAMRHLAEHADLGACSAKDLAEMYSIPQEALAKILQRLTKVGLLTSLYGTNGGYILARDPRKITAYEVIRTIEGPLFMTSCSAATTDCEQSDRCTVSEPKRKDSS